MGPYSWKAPSLKLTGVCIYGEIRVVRSIDADEDVGSQSCHPDHPIFCQRELRSKFLERRRGSCRSVKLDIPSIKRLRLPQNLQFSESRKMHLGTDKP